MNKGKNVEHKATPRKPRVQEGRRQEAEGRRQEAEGRRLKSLYSKLFNLFKLVGYFRCAVLDLSIEVLPISSSPTPPLLLITVASIVGITTVLTGCASSPTDSPSPSPTVTSLSGEEIESYARAVLSIETSRRAAYEEIQKLTNNETVPDVMCTQADSVAALSNNIQEIAVNYCDRSKKFIQDAGLTISKFNSITSTAQSNSEVNQRIQTELVRLQPK